MLHRHQPATVSGSNWPGAILARVQSARIIIFRTMNCESGIAARAIEF